MTDTEYDADYIRYMLGGADAVPSSPEVKVSSPSPQRKTNKNNKQYASIVKAFQGTLQRDWLEVDDNLGAVMKSISNLRERIYWSSEQQQKLLRVKRSNFSPARRRPTVGRVHLTHADIELGLQHDLQQHEQMMVGARSLLSNLNQGQEALGRRLDEAMQYIMEEDEYCDSNNDSTAMEYVYRELAEALYQKQVLVLNVMKCTNDDLLANEHSASDGGQLASAESDDPRNAAQICVDKWVQPQVQELWSLYS